jgi:hypothetical protein
MKLAWGAKVSREFAQKAIRISRELGFPTNDFMSCMAFESGETFSPSIRNKQSSATGLIQFMRYTAPHLGTTVEDLARMTAVQQLDYVRKYFLPHKGRLHDIEDLYMAILWPAAVGKPSSYVLFDEHVDKTHAAYFVNKGLDANHNGQITKHEAAAGPRGKLAKGIQPPYVLEIPDGEPAAVPMPTPRPVAADEPAELPAEAPAEPEAADDAPVTLPPGPKVVPGDPDTYWIQVRLSGMNYYRGMLDGNYGGKVAGAIAGFLNDWPDHDPDLRPPVNDVQFYAMRDELRRVIHDAELQQFKRPVTQARRDADPAVLKEVAPEVTTQKRGFLATAWSAIVAAVLGLWDTFSSHVIAAWTWISGNKDAIPDDAVEHGVSFVSKIPIGVWLIGGAAVLAFVAFTLIHAVHKTIDDVRTGRR